MEDVVRVNSYMSENTFYYTLGYNRVSGYSNPQKSTGLNSSSTLDFNKLAWQAGLICTSVGSTRTNAKTFDREAAIASLKGLNPFVSNEQFAFAA